MLDVSPLQVMPDNDAHPNRCETSGQGTQCVEPGVEGVATPREPMCLETEGAKGRVAAEESRTEDGSEKPRSAGMISHRHGQDDTQRKGAGDIDEECWQRKDTTPAAGHPFDDPKPRCSTQRASTANGHDGQQRCRHGTPYPTPMRLQPIHVAEDCLVLRML